MKRLLIYSMIVCSSFGVHLFSVGVGPFQLTAYRLLLIILFFCEIIKSKGILLKRDYVYSFLRFLVLYSVITIIWAKSISKWIQYEYFVVSALMVLFVIYNNISDFEFVNKCLKAFSFSVTLQAVIGLLEVMTRHYYFADPNVTYYYTRFGEFPPVAMLYNCNNFGLFMLVGVSVTVALLFSTNHFWGRVLCISQIALFSGLIVISTSRGCLLGLLMIAVLVCYLRINSRALRRLVVFVAIIIALVTIATGANIDLSRYGDVSRIVLIQQGFSILGDSFGFGVGSGQVSEWLSLNYGGIEALHNWWMELLVTYGVVFVIYYICVYATILKNLWNTILLKVDRQTKGICVGVVSFLISFAFSSLTVSNVMSLEWFWILWGICVSVNTYCVRLKKANSKRGDGYNEGVICYHESFSS